MDLFFYLFAGLMVVSSLLVITSKNPVYSVLWLIFTFCNAAGLMVLIGAEFLAMMLIVIYVGAVAVLFLFVVMMLNINFAEMKGTLKKNLSMALSLGLILLANLLLIILLGAKNIIPQSDIRFRAPNDLGNTYAIGQVLYTDFILPFQIAGIILFVAMIACIALTLRRRSGVKKQNATDQLARNKENGMSLEKPLLNTGIEGIKYE